MTVPPGSPEPQPELDPLDEQLLRQVRGMISVDRAVDRYHAQLADKLAWSSDFSFAGTAL